MLFIRECMIEKKHGVWVIENPQGYTLDLVFWNKHDAVRFVCEHY